jgi:hypothetical protein
MVRDSQAGQSQPSPKRNQVRRKPAGQPYLADRLFRIGLALLVGGSGPLLVVILLARLGVTSDPNPNPVGPGLLASLTCGPPSS